MTRRWNFGRREKKGGLVLNNGIGVFNVGKRNFGERGRLPGKKKNVTKKGQGDVRSKEKTEKRQCHERPKCPKKGERMRLEKLAL